MSTDTLSWRSSAPCAGTSIYYLQAYPCSMALVAVVASSLRVVEQLPPLLVSPSFGTMLSIYLFCWIIGLGSGASVATQA